MSETVPPQSLPTMAHPPAIPFGPDANCTLAICSIEWTVYKYRPSLPANIAFLAMFIIAMALHIVLCVRWRTWWFTAFMVAGCVGEIIGYAGRILLYKNPFSFVGFLIQIIFITSGPVFYTAAIYITLSTTCVILNLSSPAHQSLTSAVLDISRPKYPASSRYSSTGCSSPPILCAYLSRLLGEPCQPQAQGQAKLAWTWRWRV